MGDCDTGGLVAGVWAVGEGVGCDLGVVEGGEGGVFDERGGEEGGVWPAAKEVDWRFGVLGEGGHCVEVQMVLR